MSAPDGSRGGDPSRPDLCGRRVLTIDRGNTTLDCCLVTGSGPPRRERFAPAAADLVAFVGAERPEVAVAVTVVDGGLERARAQLAGIGVSLQVAGEDLVCPLELAYPDPLTLGADRWVAAVAARERFGDALIVDCGTAVTFGLVTRGGRFLGGAIGAGLGTVAAALAAHAPALPHFDGLSPGALPAVTTQDAVRAGVGTGFAAMVEALAAQLAGAAGLPGAARVATGGDAEALLGFGAVGFHLVPDLVHEGLRCLIRTRPSSC